MHSFYRCLRESSTLRNQEAKGLLASSIKPQTSKKSIGYFGCYKWISIFKVLSYLFSTFVEVIKSFKSLFQACLASTKLDLGFLALDLFFQSQIHLSKGPLLKIQFHFHFCKSIFLFALENVHEFSRKTCKFSTFRLAGFFCVFLIFFILEIHKIRNFFENFPKN